MQTRSLALKVPGSMSPYCRRSTTDPISLLVLQTKSLPLLGFRRETSSVSKKDALNGSVAWTPNASTTKLTHLMFMMMLTVHRQDRVVGLKRAAGMSEGGVMAGLSHSMAHRWYTESQATAIRRHSIGTKLSGNSYLSPLAILLFNRERSRAH